MTIDKKILKNPTSEWRGKPFWSLNGKLEKRHLKYQIEVMKKMGFGGAFLHSRTGLVTEYMSEEWLDMIGFAADELEANGMEAYLYDEDRWPSGTCGGWVTAEEKYGAKYMSYREYLKGDKLPERFIALFNVERDENGAVVCYERADVLTAVNGRAYAFYWDYAEADSFYNGNRYVDTMYRPATERFIELTHERYKKAMGDKFGKIIAGVFTDEPNRGPFLNGFSHKGDNVCRHIPYTFALFREFYKRTGYRIEERLPLLWFGKSGEKWCKETYDLIEVLQQLFLENFAKPYYEWCKNNNLVLTGHILHEDNLLSQSTMCGSVMRYYPYMDYPGMDNLCEVNYAYNVPKLVSSIKRQFGKKYVLSELYAATGWKMRLDDYKHTGEWQSALGVNFRCPHLSWYTMKGEAKRDCPASILHQSNWHDDWNYLESYFARLNYLLSLGEDVTDAAIINPVESVWGLSNERAIAPPFGAKCPLISKITKDYLDLYEEICKNGLTADYIDEGILKTYGKVVGEKLYCGKVGYKRIILCSNLHLRNSTLEFLKKFSRNGGKVFVIGMIPRYIDGKPVDFNACGVPFEMIEIKSETLKNNLGDAFMHVDGGKLIAVRRKYSEKEGFAYFVNTQKNECAKAVVTLNGEYVPTGINLRTGEFFATEYKFADGKTVIEKSFAGSEEFAFRYAKKSRSPREEKFSVQKTRLPETFEYTLDEPNVLPLAAAESYLDGEYFLKGDMNEVDKALRRRFNLEPRGGEMFQPWYKDKFLGGRTKKYGEVRLKIPFYVESVPKNLALVGEDLALCKTSANGKPVNGEIKESIYDNCFTSADIAVSSLKIGENVIEITFDFTEAFNVENYYLVGDFGVNYKNDALSKLPDRLTLTNLTEQGLAYYGGKVTLNAKMQNGEYLFKTEDIDCALIKVNGNIAAFQPFETKFTVKDEKMLIELCLTRKNMFEKTLSKSGLCKKTAVYKIIR